MTEPSPCNSLEDAVQTLEGILVFNSRTDYLAFLLWGAHTRMRGLLPSELCLYLAFEGKKSAGKSTATRCASYIAKKGMMYASITPASLKRICEEGVTLCIDEVDALAKSDEQIATILRVGNSWDAQSSHCDVIDGKWGTVKINIGGPKAFNFRGEIDDALKSRCFTISMPSCKDHQIIQNGLFAQVLLHPVSEWLDRSVSEAVQLGGYDHQKVEQLFKSEAFIDRWKGLGGDLGRNIAQAGIMLLISDILGWEIEEQIREMMDSQVPEDPFILEKEIIANEYYIQKQNQTKQTMEGLSVPNEASVPSEELRRALNISLREKGQPDYSKKRFGDLKKELGWVNGLNERKDSRQKGKHILYYDSVILKSLGIDQP
jgi:hypothetical protein